MSSQDTITPLAAEIPEETEPAEIPPETVTHTTTIEFVRPWLYPKQFDAIYDPRRIACIEASTKSGKTVGCAVWLAEQAFLGTSGQNYWWIAPVSDQANIAFIRMQRFLPRDGFTAVKNPARIILMNGTIIWFKSGDKPDSLYGEDVHAAVVDEASRLKEDAWIAVRSTLTATRGPARLIGNVKGRKNWFYRLARIAEQTQDTDGAQIAYHKIVAPDAVQAGVLVGEEIEAARVEMRNDAAWRELFFAEASDDQGNPFGLEAIRARILPGLVPANPVAWGWDLAKKHDFTVGIGLDANGHVARFERFQLPWGETKDRIRQMTGRLPALVDSTGVGDAILEDLQRARYARDGDRHVNLHVASNFEGYLFTPASKQKLMEGLAASIQGGEIGYPDGVIVAELEQFEYEYTRTGVRYSAPEGLFDDCVCALALADIHRKRVPAPLKIPAAALARAHAPAMPGRMMFPRLPR